MKILLCSVFHPSIGGLETVISILAQEWTRLGHQVRIVTDVPAEPSAESTEFPFEVVRCPSARRLLDQVAWCEVYVQGGISLKTMWPLALRARRYVVTHQTWYRRPEGGLGWQDHLKRLVTRRAVNIACSHEIAHSLPAPCAVVPNPYDPESFFARSDGEREREIVFVGRLVSDKGVDLLLEALERLRRDGVRAHLTVIGGGPERPALERQARDLKLEEQVAFVGKKTPHEVARLLNQHQVLAVPSLWKEPFGVVALEGIACGCVVVGSEGGGLKEAIGPCGLTFPNGNATRLAEQLARALCDKVLAASLCAPAPEHLARHRPEAVARRYLEIIGATEPSKRNKARME